MLATEGVMLGLTFVLPRRKGNAEISGKRYFVLWILCVLAILGTFSTQRLGLIGVLRPDADMVEVELLQDAVGRKFGDLRIAKYLDRKPADFSHGEQYWVLYRRSCPFCHELFKSKYNVRDPGKTVVAVEIPLSPEAPSKEASDDPLGLIYQPIVCVGCERATLPGGREWKIRTPLVIHVKDGVVAGVDRYLDMRHDVADPLGRRWAGDIDVDRAYDWDPATVVPGVGDERIEGVEAPLWTEKVRTIDEVEHLCFPRLMCLAEVGWTPQPQRELSEFRVRVSQQVRRLVDRGVHAYLAGGL
jgi:hypothetical protein